MKAVLVPNLACTLGKESSREVDRCKAHSWDTGLQYWRYAEGTPAPLLVARVLTLLPNQGASFMEDQKGVIIQNYSSY